MTTADRLRAEGDAQGRAKVLLQLLTVKFGSVPRSVTDIVTNADPEQVLSWSSMVLTAGTFEEIFGAH